MNLNQFPSYRLTAFFAFSRARVLAQLQTVSSEECDSETACLAYSEHQTDWRSPPPRASACYSSRLVYYKQLINQYLPKILVPVTIEQKICHSNLTNGNFELGLRVRHEFFRTIKLKPLRPMVRRNKLKAKGRVVPCDLAWLLYLPSLVC